MKYSTDYLDAYCKREYGHDNWQFFNVNNTDLKKEVLKLLKTSTSIATVIIVYKEPDGDDDE